MKKRGNIKKFFKTGKELLLLSTLCIKNQQTGYQIKVLFLNQNRNKLLCGYNVKNSPFCFPYFILNLEASKITIHDRQFSHKP